MILHLKMTDDEYDHIQGLLSYYMKKYQDDVDNISWYDFKYISSALEYAKQDGKIYRKKGGRKNANDQ